MTKFDQPKVNWKVIYDPTRNGEWYGDFYGNLFSRAQILLGHGSWPDGLTWKNISTGEICRAEGNSRHQKIRFLSERQNNKQGRNSNGFAAPAAAVAAFSGQAIPISFEDYEPLFRVS